MPNNNNGRERLEQELTTIEMKLEGLKEYVATERARRLVPIIKKSGWYKGEVYDLTTGQYRKVMGKEPKSAIMRRGKIPWEYCLDELATELGYPSDEALKKAVEDVSKRLHEIAKLKARKAQLRRELGIVKQKRPKLRVRYEKKRVPVDGRVTALEIISGKRRLGYIVAFPPSYGIYKAVNGLDIRVAPVGGALSITKAKDIAKKKLRRVRGVEIEARRKKKGARRASKKGK